MVTIAMPGLVILSFKVKSNFGFPNASLISSSSTLTFWKLVVSLAVAYLYATDLQTDPTALYTYDIIIRHK